MGNMLLNSNEILSRNTNSQLPATVIMLKEDLEKKKVVVQNKVADADEDIQLNREELNVRLYSS